MKKIFTLLFCVTAMALAASANDNVIEQCINHVLNDGTATTMTRATELDANNDGVINITDATVLINRSLNGSQVNNAPTVERKKTQIIIGNVLNDPKPEYSIKDATESINQDLKDK